MKQPCSIEIVRGSSQCLRSLHFRVCRDFRTLANAAHEEELLQFGLNKRIERSLMTWRRTQYHHWYRHCLKITGKFTVDRDATDAQLGRVLLPVQKDKHLKPVSNWSRSLRSADYSKDSTYKECLPKVWLFLMLPTYSEWTHFVSCTDHRASKW